jgi:hypothetical protein
MAAVPKYLHDVVKRAGYEESGCCYVGYDSVSSVGLELLTEDSEERYMLTAGFLTCQSLTIHFPVAKAALMTHHNPMRGDTYGSLLDRVCEMIIEKHPWLRDEEGEFTLFEHMPLAGDGMIYSCLRRHFPNMSASEYQEDHRFRQISQQFMIYMDKISGTVSKKIYPLCAE